LQLKEKLKKLKKILPKEKKKKTDIIDKFIETNPKNWTLFKETLINTTIIEKVSNKNQLI
jgi:hypothetical protein